MELKKLKKLVLQLEKELESQQQHTRTSSRLVEQDHLERERELEEKLEERERDMRELRRQVAAGREGDEGDDVVRELEMHNAQLEEEIENMRELLQDNMDEIERLKDLVERNASSSLSDNSGRLNQRLHDLDDENTDLRHRLEDHIELLAQKDEEREDLLDAIDTLKLELEEIHRKREADHLERSHSRALVLEEREEREQVEEDLNTMKDRLAALLIEVQQKEDECEQKAAEIDELVAEHKRIVEVVEDEWRGEVEEARMQVEELKDVRRSFSLRDFPPLTVTHTQVLSERETELRDIKLTLDEHENRTSELRNEFEMALNDLELQAETKDAQIEAMRTTIDKLGR
jgi:gas vesicle protein